MDIHTLICRSEVDPRSATRATLASNRDIPVLFQTPEHVIDIPKAHRQDLAEPAHEPIMYLVAVARLLDHERKDDAIDQRGQGGLSRRRLPTPKHSPLEPTPGLYVGVVLPHVYR
jgi:hypothetical protein